MEVLELSNMKKPTFDFNYPELRTGDLVLCGSTSLLAAAIRFFSVGWKETFNYSKTSHVGVIVEANGQKFIAEMLGPGLEINSLETYNKKNNPAFILDIRRNVKYDDAKKRNRLNKVVWNDYRHMLDYDIKGLLEFIFKKVKDNKNKFYCSEYFYARTKEDGIEYPENFEKMVSPDDLSKLKDWTSIDWEA